jgi:hypothetical protein
LANNSIFLPYVSYQMQDLTDCDYFRTPVIFRAPDIFVFVSYIKS